MFYLSGSATYHEENSYHMIMINKMHTNVGRLYYNLNSIVYTSKSAFLTYIEIEAKRKSATRKSGMERGNLSLYFCFIALIGYACTSTSYTISFSFGSNCTKLKQTKENNKKKEKQPPDQGK